MVNIYKNLQFIIYSLGGQLTVISRIINHVNGILSYKDYKDREDHYESKENGFKILMGHLIIITNF